MDIIEIFKADFPVVSSLIVSILTLLFVLRRELADEKIRREDMNVKHSDAMMEMIVAKDSNDIAVTDAIMQWAKQTEVRMQRAEETADKLRELLGALRSELDVAKEQLLSANEQLEAANIKIRYLDTELTKAQDENALLLVQLQSLKEENCTLHNQIADQKKRIDKLEKGTSDEYQ